MPIPVSSTDDDAVAIGLRHARNMADEEAMTCSCARAHAMHQLLTDPATRHVLTRAHRRAICERLAAEALAELRGVVPPDMVP